MLRSSKRQLKPLLACIRQFQASAGQAAGAAPARVDDAASYAVQYSGPSVSKAPPLTTPLPGVVTKHAYEVPSAPPATRITTLPNGVRVATEASPGPTASLGIYINSGSIYESAATAGASCMLEAMAWKATSNRTTFRLMREVEKLGANVTASASREQMCYTIDALKTNVPEAVEMLCDAVLNPRFAPHELEEQRSRLETLLKDPTLAPSLLTEATVRAAYSGPLGNPLIPDASSLAKLTPEALQAFVTENYSAPRMVLAGAGVEHSALLSVAQPMLQTLPAVAAPAEPQSQYRGAHIYVPGTAPEASLILAFEYKGGWKDVQGAATMVTLTHLLGGGSSFSSGGPGKGMHSRLYTRVLNQYGWAHSCAAYSDCFGSSGLVGVQAACEPGQANAMLDVMCTELESLASGVPAAELDRAKRRTAAVICNALESKETSAEDLGRQILTYGHRISGPEYLTIVENITAKHIADFVRGLLSSTPTLALHGDGTEQIKYDNVLRRYAGRK